MFASGRTTGIAVECGAGVTSTVPVFEGLALSHAAVYRDFGGQDITANLRSKLIDNKFDLSFNDTKLLKEKHCFVGQIIASSYDRKNRGTARGIRTGGPENNSKEERESFYLPDGAEVSISKDGKRLIFLFRTSPIKNFNRLVKGFAPHTRRSATSSKTIFVSAIIVKPCVILLFFLFSLFLI